TKNWSGKTFSRSCASSASRSDMSNLYADIALNLPTHSLFQYSVPQHLEGQIREGRRVWVSVRTRRMVGTVTSLSDKPSFENVRDIDGVPDDAPTLDENFLKLT